MGEMRLTHSEPRSGSRWTDHGRPRERRALKHRAEGDTRRVNAAVSTWLRTSGDPAQVAEWAGHSVAVLLRVYAKCIHGMEHEALCRIWDATRQ